MEGERRGGEESGKRKMSQVGRARRSFILGGWPATVRRSCRRGALASTVPCAEQCRLSPQRGVV